MKRSPKKTIGKIFAAKKQRRHDLAKLPVEEKVKMLVQLQKLAVPILSARGIKYRSWLI